MEISSPKVKHSIIRDKRLKEIGDTIYRTDPVNYRKLVIWMVEAQNKYDPEVIHRVLITFAPRAKEFSNEWWPYLDKLMDKFAAQANARATEQESAAHKAGDMAIAADFVEFLKQRQK